MEKPWMVWLDQAMFFCGQGRTVTLESRLAHYRAQRDAQRLPRDVCFYSIAFVLTEIAEDRMSKANAECDTLPTRHETLRASQEAPAMDSLTSRDVPDGSGVENAVRNEVYDANLTATFREHGEYEMAKLFVNEPHEFERRLEHGLRCLRGAKTHHLHRWKLVDPYAFGGPVFICRKCSERAEQKD
jgi:hypothetical protein